MKRFCALALSACLLLVGCQRQDVPDPETQPQTEPTSQQKPNTQPSADVEFTVEYDWMAGESPVPVHRIGLDRIDGANGNYAVSPSGVYCVATEVLLEGTYIYFAENGSNAFEKLCSRTDCAHDGKSCQAYVEQGGKVTYWNGHLYVLNGDRSRAKCEVIRMDSDGSNRETILDLLAFAREQGGEFVTIEGMTEGYVLFQVSRQVPGEPDAHGAVTTKTEHLGRYMYALDGSMGEPKARNASGVLYNCGECILCYSTEAKNGGEFGSLWHWEPETDTMEFLTDHPGTFGYFDEENGYYFRDGSLIRLNYQTGVEETLLETQLTGEYCAYLYPECIVIASTGKESDHILYFYNWAFEPVDQVKLNFEILGMTDAMAIVGETAEYFILTDTVAWQPVYYISKAELGTGTATVHTFGRS